MSPQPMTVAVLGAGAWGTALALQLTRVGHQVALWAHESAHADALNAERVNSRYLPGAVLPESISVTHQMDQALRGADRVLVVTPSHAFAETLDQLVEGLTCEQGLAWACKGLEPGTGRFLHAVAAEKMGTDMPLALITGPSFAHEVAAGLPTAVTVAASTAEFGSIWANLLHGSSFRAYYTADLIGAELGGALKNVIAVACGIADGLGLGQNTRAALITRGLAEMIRLGEALGANPRTLIGLAGMGDLVLTCTGDSSRNRRFGLALARGESVDQALGNIGQVVEGTKAAEEAMRLAERLGVEMPITEQVHGMIYKGWLPEHSVSALMERELRSESD